MHCGQVSDLPEAVRTGLFEASRLHLIMYYLL